MHIVIFTENSQNGGLDTFIATLLNNWPNKQDRFTIICNKTHPGVSNLKNSIEREVSFVESNVVLIWNLLKPPFFCNNFFIAKVIRQIVRILILPIQYAGILKLLSSIDSGRMLVVNGGYPGGETCRLASVAWHALGNGKSVHNFHNFSSSYKFGLGWYERMIDKRLIKSTECFVSVSKTCANSLNKRDFIWKSVPVEYIYNGISKNTKKTSVTTNLREYLNIGSAPLCLMLGTYEARKGHEFILNVFSKVVEKIPNACLVMCGDAKGEDFNRVLKLKKDLFSNAEKVFILDFIPNGSELISQSDVLLIGSQSFESFGYTAVEAMIRKIPVVSTNTGGLSEVVVNNQGGYLFDKNDVDGF